MHYYDDQLTSMDIQLVEELFDFAIEQSEQELCDLLQNKNDVRGRVEREKEKEREREREREEPWGLN